MTENECVEALIKYRTTDGTEFTDKIQANKYQKCLNILITTNKLLNVGMLINKYGTYHFSNLSYTPNKIMIRRIIESLIKNREEIKAFLDNISDTDIDLINNFISHKKF